MILISLFLVFSVLFILFTRRPFSLHSSTRSSSPVALKSSDLRLSPRHPLITQTLSLSSLLYFFSTSSSLFFATLDSTTRPDDALIPNGLRLFIFASTSDSRFSFSHSSFCSPFIGRPLSSSPSTSAPTDFVHAVLLPRLAPFLCCNNHHLIRCLNLANAALFSPQQSTSSSSSPSLSRLLIAPVPTPAVLCTGLSKRNWSTTTAATATWYHPQLPCQLPLLLHPPPLSRDLYSPQRCLRPRRDAYTRTKYRRSCPFLISALRLWAIRNLLQSSIPKQ